MCIDDCFTILGVVVLIVMLLPWFFTAWEKSSRS